MVWKMLAMPSAMVRSVATLHDEHAERNADGDGDGHGDDHQREVIERGAENFGAMVEEEGPRAHWEAPGMSASEAVKARTSG